MDPREQEREMLSSAIMVTSWFVCFWCKSQCQCWATGTWYFQWRSSYSSTPRALPWEYSRLGSPRLQCLLLPIVEMPSSRNILALWSLLLWRSWYHSCGLSLWSVQKLPIFFKHGEPIYYCHILTLPSYNILQRLDKQFCLVRPSCETILCLNCLNFIFCQWPNQGPFFPSTWLKLVVMPSAFCMVSTYCVSINNTTFECFIFYPQQPLSRWLGY